MTRMRLIQMWFAAVTLTILGAVMLGTTLTVASAGMLVVLSMVPAAIVLALWPGELARTAADVLYDRNLTP